MQSKTFSFSHGPLHCVLAVKKITCIYIFLRFMDNDKFEIGIHFDIHRHLIFLQTFEITFNT